MSWRIGAAVVAVAVLWLGWTRLFPSDEARITAVLAQIADALNTEGAGSGSGGLDALSRVSALQNEFTVDATVDAGPPFQRLVGRQSIVGAAARIGTAVRNLEIQFADIVIDVGEGKDTATAVVTAEARFDDGEGGRTVDARELEIGFARVDGNWKVSAVKLLQPLQRVDE